MTQQRSNRPTVVETAGIQTILSRLTELDENAKFALSAASNLAQRLWAIEQLPSEEGCCTQTGPYAEDVCGWISSICASVGETMAILEHLDARV